MGKGRNLSNEIRNIIYTQLNDLDYSIDNIYNMLSIRFPGLVTKSTLQRLQRLFKSKNKDKVNLYLAGPLSKAHHTLKLKDHEIDFIEFLLLHYSSSTHKEIARIYQRERGGDYTPSNSTIRRIIKMKNITSKKPSLIQALVNTQAEVDHLDLLKYIDFKKLINIDETHKNDEKCRRKLVRGYKGQRVRRKQWKINGKHYSICAIYGYYGFISWQIYEKNMDHESFEHFLEYNLRPIYIAGHVVLLDNATTHKFGTTLALLEEITGGMQKCVPPWCHHLSPIERGFSQVWGDIRKTINNSMTPNAPLVNVEAVIQASFSKYSIIGEMSSVAKKNWGIYERNNMEYIRECNM